MDIYDELRKMGKNWKDNEYILEPIQSEVYNRAWSGNNFEPFYDTRTLLPDRFGVGFIGVDKEATYVKIDYNTKEMQLLSIWYADKEDFERGKINQYTFIAKVNYPNDMFPKTLKNTLGTICWEECNFKALQLCLNKLQLKIAKNLADKKIDWNENTKKFVDFLLVYLCCTEEQRKNDFIVYIEPVMFWENKYTDLVNRGGETLPQNNYIKLEGLISLYAKNQCMDAYAVASKNEITEYDKKPINSHYGFYNTKIMDDTEENLDKAMNKVGDYYDKLLKCVIGENPPMEYLVKYDDKPLYAHPLYCDVMVEFDNDELFNYAH